MSRFAILEHDYPVLHWDLLLEHGDVLLTWRLSAPPESGVIVDAIMLPDHRPLYLDYEGPVSGDRGSVTRWDGGTFVGETGQSAEIAVRLSGAKLRGLLRLERLEGEIWHGEFFMS